jgi:hypothetical protein
MVAVWCTQTLAPPGLKSPLAMASAKAILCFVSVEMKVLVDPPPTKFFKTGLFFKHMRQAMTALLIVDSVVLAYVFFCLITAEVSDRRNPRLR